MLGSWLLDIVVLAVLVVYAVFIYMFIQRLKKINNTLNKFSSEHDLEAQLMDIFSGELDTSKIQSFANRLFNYAKKTYHLKANSYSQIIDEIKSSQHMDEEIKSSFLDFFEEIIAVLYKNTSSLSEEEKHDLRKKVKVIVRSIEEKS